MINVNVPGTDPDRWIIEVCNAQHYAKIERLRLKRRNNLILILSLVPCWVVISVLFFRWLAS